MKTSYKIIFFKGLFILIILFSVSQILSAQQNYEFPYLNPGLSVETRVNDMVDSMSLDEKISQMMNTAPAIDRLGILPDPTACFHSVCKTILRCYCFKKDEIEFNFKQLMV